MPLSPDQKRKLVGLLGQLGHDNERIRSSAGIAADRLVKMAGETWEKLMSLPPELEPPEEFEGEIGAKFTASEWEEFTGSMEPDNDWERSYLADMDERYGKYGMRTRLSAKQYALLLRIWRASH